MPPTTPLVLVDNVLDTISQYVAGTLTANTEASGYEAWHVADGRRDRTWWAPTSDGGGAPGNIILADLGAGVTRAVDSLWLDRGHNLATRIVAIEGSADGAIWDVGTAVTVPAANVVGGDPASGTAARTEEGACYAVFAPLAARRWWRFRVNYYAGFVPVVTGVMMGQRIQLLGYPLTRDEDEGSRVVRTEQSDAGYLGTGPVYTWRRLSLPMRLIGAAEYDTTMRDLRRRLFQRGQPAFVAMDYATYPERGWLYVFDGDAWSAPLSTVYRTHTIPLRETGALVT